MIVNLDSKRTEYQTLANMTYSLAPVVWQKLCAHIPLTGADQLDLSWLGRAPDLEEWLDERNIRGVSENEFLIKTQRWAHGVGVTRNDLEYSRDGLVKLRIRDMSLRAAKHPDKRAFNTLNNGTSILGYDGKALFANDHPDGKGGSVDNLLAGTGTTTAQIASDWLTKVLPGMAAFVVDANGPDDTEVTDIVPDTVICPRAMYQNIYTVFTAESLDGTNPNACKGMISPDNIIASSLLTDSNDWFPAYTGGEIKPLVLVENRPYEPDFSDKDEFTKGLYYFGGQREYTVKPMAWWTICSVVNT